MIVMQKIQLYLWNILGRVRINLSLEGSDKTSNKKTAQKEMTTTQIVLETQTGIESFFS